MATLHMAGQTVGEDRPLRLAAGWNLAGYLPQMSLPVTAALQSIDGSYASLLGFAGTAVSYYPGLEGNYNTLARLRPSAGYWISATQAVTLQYPSTVSMTLPITGTATMSETLALLFRLAAHPVGRAGGGGAADLPLGQPVRQRLPARRQPGAHQHAPSPPWPNGVPCGATRGHRARPLRAAGLLRRR